VVGPSGGGVWMGLPLWRSRRFSRKNEVVLLRTVRWCTGVSVVMCAGGSFCPYRISGASIGTLAGRDQACLREGLGETLRKVGRCPWDCEMRAERVVEVWVVADE